MYQQPETDDTRSATHHRISSAGIWCSKAVSTVEYALILTSVAVVAIGAIALFGQTIRGAFGNVAGGLRMDETPEGTQTITPAVGTGTPTVVTTAPPGTATAAAAIPTATSERPLQGTATPPSATATLLPRQPQSLIDNFDDGNADGWLVNRGIGWTVKDGQYCNDTAKSGERRTFVGDPSWTDYTVSFKAFLADGWGWALYFRATDLYDLDAYAFQYDPGYGSGAFLFRQIVDNNEQSPFGRLNLTPEYEWYNTWHTVSVRVQGSTYTTSIDGKQVLQASHSGYTRGQTGLRLWDSSIACFDDFVVAPLGP